MSLMNPNHPYWDKPICLLPWVENHLLPESVHFCCYNRELYGVKYPFPFSDQGPYGNKLDFWNSSSFTRARAIMLEEGQHVACKNIPCPANVGRRTMRENYHIICKKVSKESLNKVLKSIFNNQITLDYPPLRNSSIITDVCDAQCAFCFQHTRRSQGIIGETVPEDKQDTFIDYLNRHESVCLVGGELLCMPKPVLKKFVTEVTRKHNFEISTNSNKLTLDNYRLLCVEGNVNNILISLNTSSVQEYKNGDVIENIRKSRKNLEAICAKYKKHCICAFTVVTSKSVLPAMPEIVDMAHEFGVKNVCFLRLIPGAMVRWGLGDEDICGSGYSEKAHQDFIHYSTLAKERAKLHGVTVHALEVIEKALNEKRASLQALKENGQ